jgi:hypothetical protein
MVKGSFTNEASASRALEEVESASKAVETSCSFMLYAETSVGELEEMEGKKRLGLAQATSQRTKVYLFTVSPDARLPHRPFLQGYCTGSADPILRGEVLF